MRRWPVIAGGCLILIGLMILVNNIFHINIWKYLWPVLLIGVGLLLILRPKMPRGWWSDLGYMTEEPRAGEVYAGEDSQSGFIDNRNIDLEASKLLPGLNHYDLRGFVGDIKLRVPAGVGIKARANCFVGEIHLFGEESTGIMAPVEEQSADFETLEKKVVVDLHYFVGELHVIRKE